MSNKRLRLIEIVVVILIFIGIIIANNLLTKPDDYYVICKFKKIYSTYKETIKFKYNKNTMTDFYRHEEMTSIDNKDEKSYSVDELYDYFTNIKKGYEFNENYTYDVIKKDDHIEIDTYVNVLEYENEVDNYFEELYIKHTYNKKELIKELESTNYTCEVSYE